MATDHANGTGPTCAGQLDGTSMRFARRPLAIGENRVEWLMVEVQEERRRLRHAILLALGVAAFGLLAGVALTGVIVILFWKLLFGELSWVAAMLVFTGLYGSAAACLYPGVTRLLRDWRDLHDTEALIVSAHRDEVYIEQVARLAPICCRDALQRSRSSLWPRRPAASAQTHEILDGGNTPRLTPT